MPSIRKSALVPHPPATMFDLVDAVERYPEFLPWCRAAEVLSRDAATTRARLHVDYHGLRMRFTTRNRKQRPDSMALALEEGPFESLAGEWRFVAIGSAGCRVELALDYAFSSGALEALAARVFDGMAETLIERFVARAATLA